MKCRLCSADLPQAVVGLLPVLGELVDEGALHAPAVARLGHAVVARHRQGAEDLAQDVGLALVHGTVADADRQRAGVPGEAVELALGEVAAALDGVHHLHVGRVSGDGAQQPVAPVVRIVGAPGGEQRLQGEGRVAQPAVAVVPVALAAEVLGQGGGRRGDDAAGVHVGEPAEGHQAADDLAAPRAVVLAGVGPGLLLLQGVGQPLVDVQRLGNAAVGRHPGEREVQPVTLVHVEGLLVGPVVRRGQPRPGEDELVGSCDRDDGGAAGHLLAVHPGPDPAVVEADHPAVPERDGPAHALHPAYDVGAALAGGHQVGHPDLAGLRAVRRLEDCGVADVAALGGVLTDGPEEPVAVVVVAQQPGEAGRGVELRQAQPVQGAVDADQCRGVAVADGGVVLDRQRHAGRLDDQFKGSHISALFLSGH